MWLRWSQLKPKEQEPKTTTYGTTKLLDVRNLGKWANFGSKTNRN